MNITVKMSYQWMKQPGTKIWIKNIVTALKDMITLNLLRQREKEFL